MLVLGRKPGEYIVIDEKIKVKVVKSESGQLRLAIDAPREMRIVRGEVWEEENAQTVV
ncbi:carbon storage regulator [Tepidibacter hydrothermalis]|uniref:Translational regulator CsrA n=1 Tax=Tepidibacter hydrothermalis TaxID=3036126 RepID=A0ABY8EGQ6_9FIRM|nr:carbon storage regulator [Tepidibacter hydrothermalis]WFD10035.1 carbon storage regulator [Tepidibacter hydrothermalis]